MSKSRNYQESRGGPAGRRLRGYKGLGKIRFACFDGSRGAFGLFRRRKREIEKDQEERESL